ncbi:spermidine synthase [Phytoactinopolyspora endophytica]|uniref:spermidine synthase n=1 Tax=Phytoactinopolyspora endophytica TaxID=1642495 RepID=UPI00101C8357|nr:hypothetical protein [Phytoactinopolyspora endophytica]
MHEPPETVARGDGVAGELALRRRHTTSGEVYELIVNGTFLMDTAETSTERLLADVLLDRHDSPRRVLVGGLGLGFTVDALLADPRVERIDVVELEPLLVDWLRAGMVPSADVTMSDARVRLEIGDIHDVLTAAPPHAYDGFLLDVDNGPGFLVRDANAQVYRRPSLRAAASALTPGGVLAVWSAAPSDQLAIALADTVGEVTELTRTVPREGREVDYHIYLARRPYAA